MVKIQKHHAADLQVRLVQCGLNILLRFVQLQEVRFRSIGTGKGIMGAVGDVDFQQSFFDSHS